MPVMRLELGDNTIPMAQYLVYPPLEGRFFNNMICDCIRGEFKGIQILEVLGGTQSSDWLFLESNQKFPTSCHNLGLLHTIGALYHSI